MDKLEQQYLNLLKDILENGTRKQDRTGTGTISVFGRQIRHNMKDGFPLLTTKKMAWKTMVTELLWFLRGDTNIKYLVDNDCHIWDGDAYKYWCKQFEVNPNNFNGEEVAKGHNDQCWGYPLLENTSKEYKRGQINAYLEGKADKPFFYLTQEEFINKIKTDDEFAEKWGELGPVYGQMWRDWDTDTGEKIDQIQNLINDLKSNPDSRRLMVNAWNPTYIPHCVLPPCHYGFQVYTRELSYEERCDIFKPNTKNFRTETNSVIKDLNIKIMNDTETPTRAISLMWNQRSVDTFLGLPFNIASYGLLLEIIAKAVNMVPDQLIGNLGDVHLYSNHIEQAKEQIGRELTLEERRKMVTQEMFNQIYNGGGPESLSHSEINQWGIPRRTREPYPLPTLKINSGNENWHLLDIGDIVQSLDTDITFKLENYEYHPTIKAPLSN